MGFSCNHDIHLNYTDYQNISGRCHKGLLQPCKAAGGRGGAAPAPSGRPAQGSRRPSAQWDFCSTTRGTIVRRGPGSQTPGPRCVCSEGQLSTGGLGGGPCGAGGSRRGRGSQWIQDRGQRQVLLSPAVPHPGHRALAMPEPLSGVWHQGTEPVPRQSGETPPPRLACASPGPVGMHCPLWGVSPAPAPTRVSAPHPAHAQAHPGGSVLASLP